MNYLFTYGLLQSTFDNQYSKSLQGNAEKTGVAYTYGLLYEIDGYPGMIISQEPGHKVYGELYRLDDQLLLQELDQFEGIGTEYSKPHEYKREIIEVYSENKIYKAWAYLYNWKVNTHKIILNGDYLEYQKNICQG